MMASRPIATRVSLTGLGTMGIARASRRSPPHCLRRRADDRPGDSLSRRSSSCARGRGGASVREPALALAYRSGVVWSYLEYGPMSVRPGRAGGMSPVSPLDQSMLQLHAESCHLGAEQAKRQNLKVSRPPKQTYLDATGEHGEIGNNLPKITIEFMVALEAAQN